MQCDLLSGDKVTATGYTDISILSLLAKVWSPTWPKPSGAQGYLHVHASSGPFSWGLDQV